MEFISPGATWPDCGGTRSGKGGAYDPDLGRWSQLESGEQTVLDRLHEQRYLYTHELQQVGRTDLADMVAASRSRWRMLFESRSGLWPGIRKVLAGEKPAGELHYLNVPDGTVDLRTGELQDHSPDYGCRAVTRGRYRPEDSERLRAEMELHLEPVLEPEALDAMLDLVGLAMTGRAQTYWVPSSRRSQGVVGEW